MFNENKYKKCIKHLIDIKTTIIIAYTAIFTLIGVGIGVPIMMYKINAVAVVIFTTAIGALMGLCLGLSVTWKIEMRIQEAYWKIDMLNESKKCSEQKNDNPVSKTIISIENKQIPNEPTKTEIKEIKN